jgi:hypothetical protein
MELMYSIRNYWGSGQVDEAEARRVYDTWELTPGQHIDGDLETGFTAWVESEAGGRLMGTQYKPLSDEAAT